MDIQSLPRRFEIGRILPLGLAVAVVLRFGGASSAADEPANPAGGVAASEVITTVGQLYELPDTLKDAVLPARMEIVLNYYDSDPGWKVLFGKSGGFDTYIPLENTSPRIHAGQRVLVEGTISRSKGLNLRDAKITVLAESEPVQPLSTRGHIADHAQFSGHLVTAEAYVNRQAEIDGTHLLLELAIEGRAVRARVPIENDSPVPQVEGARIRLKAVYVESNSTVAGAPLADLWIPRASDIEILGWLDNDPAFNLPLTTIDRLPSVPAQTLVHVIGLVRSREAGSIVVRDETGQLTLFTGMTRFVGAGERVEAIGLVAQDGPDVVLREVLFRLSKEKLAAPSMARGLPLLRLIDQVRNLKPEEAERGYAVKLNGIVTWSSKASRRFFLRDTSGGIGVEFSSDNIPAVGNEVSVTGVSAVGTFAPIVKAERVTGSGVQVLPDARVVSLEHAMTGVEEGQLVRLSGYVRATSLEGPSTRLDLTTSAGEFAAYLPTHVDLQSLVGDTVNVRGVCQATANAQRQLTGIQLLMVSNDDIEVEEAKPADPFVVPQRSIASLRQFSTLGAFNRRVRIAGTVLNFEPGRFLSLQEGTQGLLVLTRETTPLRPGDRVEAVGFPGRQGNRIVLREALYRTSGHGPEPPPVALTQLEPVDPELDGRLVRIEATLLDVSSQQAGLKMNCQAAGTVFEATMNPAAGAPPRPILVGSRVELKGVYESESDGVRPHALRLRLRSTADVRVLSEPSWWTAQRALSVAGFLAVAILLGLGWVTALRRRVRRQTEQIRQQLEKAARLEMELVRSSKLDSLGVLAGGIAHDFNNLLTVVMGNLSLVITDRQIDDEAQHFLRESERAALRARDLTQQLLTFAKGGAPVRSAVLLPDIVREAAGFALHGSNVRCEFDFSAELWPAEADRGQTAQVVQNLVINAMQAMPAGGIIRITLRNETIAAGDRAMLAAGRYLRLSIIDSGAGIQPDHLARIFEPYFTTKQHGSGLGLATVYSIIKKHGGHIEVASKLGVGTTFNIWLPASERAPETTVTTMTRAPVWSGRVLFMDDEEPIRQFAHVLLGRMGFEVTVTCDGAEAVGEFAAAREAGRPYAFVILDLTVPGGMGGSEALGRLREVDPKVRAIVSSGYSNDPILANYRAHGLCGIVPKPYQANDLIAAVNSIMQDARN